MKAEWTSWNGMNPLNDERKRTVIIYSWNQFTRNSFELKQMKAWMIEWSGMYSVTCSTCLLPLSTHSLLSFVALSRPPFISLAFGNFNSFHFRSIHLHYLHIAHSLNTIYTPRGKKMLKKLAIRMIPNK